MVWTHADPLGEGVDALIPFAGQCREKSHDHTVVQSYGKAEQKARTQIYTLRRSLHFYAWEQCSMLAQSNLLTTQCILRSFCLLLDLHPMFPPEHL